MASTIAGSHSTPPFSDSAASTRHSPGFSALLTVITELNADIKRTENVISTLNGKIEYAENIANEKLSEYKTFEKDEELSLAQQELSYLNTNEKLVDKENQKKVVESLEKEILSKETEFNELEQSMKSGKKTYLSIKNGTNCTCPTCNQVIQDESKSITIQNMYKEFTDLGFTCDFFITDVPIEKQLFKDHIHYNDFLSYIDVIHHIENSRGLLEIVQGGSCGLTFRDSEALAYNKNLITNNKAITKLEYSTCSKIYYINKNSRISKKEFSNSADQHFDYKNEFSPVYLLDEIEKDL